MRWHSILSAAIAAVAFLVPSSLHATELQGGGWRGSWVDNNSGHRGPLRARFRATNDCNYRVVFTGRFFKVIPFRFATTLNVVDRQGDQLIFAGESRVGGFGRFSYHAVADGDHFNAQYHSGRWTGTFHLVR
jgi:hypothetical protein